MSYHCKQNQQQASFFKHETPSHKMSSKERKNAFMKNIFEFLVFIIFIVIIQSFLLVFFFN